MSLYTTVWLRGERGETKDASFCHVIGKLYNDCIGVYQMSLAVPPSISFSRSLATVEV